MFGFCIFYLLFAVISQFITYRIMKFIDKKERKKLRKWEDNYIDELIAHRQELKNMKRIEEKEVVEE